MLSSTSWQSAKAFQHGTQLAMSWGGVQRERDEPEHGPLMGISPDVEVLRPQQDYSASSSSTNQVRQARPQASPGQTRPREVESLIAQTNSIVQARTLELEEELHAALQREKHLRWQMGELQRDTERRMQQAVRVAQEFEARQRLVDAEANEETAALRAKALEELGETKVREKATSRQLEETKRELELVRTHLERKEEDLNFCLEQLREVKMWAEQEIEALRTHAAEEVKDLKEELARCLQNAERERSRLLEELDERSRRLADTETLLLNERERCESLAKATADLSSRLEVDLEAKLALLTDEVSKIKPQSEQGTRPEPRQPSQPDVAGNDEYDVEAEAEEYAYDEEAYEEQAYKEQEHEGAELEAQDPGASAPKAKGVAHVRAARAAAGAFPWRD